MLQISTQLQDAMNQPERYGVVLFTFFMGSEIYGLWTHQGSYTYNSILYEAGGSVLELSNIEDAGDGSISEMTITLSAAPDKGLTVDVLSSFYDEDWHMQPIMVELGFRDPSTGEIIDTVVAFDGLMFQAPWRIGTGAGSKIQLRCVSNATKMSESGSKFRNAQTQALLDPTDTSLKDIGVYGSVLQKELKWGS